MPTPSIRCLLTIPLVLSLAAAAFAQTDELFDSNGTKIRYVTDGKGEAVVLLHGWMSDSSFWGRDLRGETQLNSMPGFQAIAIDCRGHGQSDKPHDVAKYGPEMAADVVRLMDHLKIEKAHFIGYSSGAFLIGKIAAMHPERVLSIIYAGQAPLLIAPKATVESAEVKKEQPSEVEVFAKVVEEGGDLGEYLIAVSPADKKLTAAQAKMLAKVFYGGKDLRAFVAAGRSYPQLAVAVEDLQRCKAPTLFLHGSEESATVKSLVQAAHERLGHGSIELVPGSDHITTPANPVFGQKVKDFLLAQLKSHQAAQVVLHDKTASELIAADAVVEKLSGALKFAEGPVWREAEQALVFSDIPAGKLLRWTAKDGVQEWQASEQSNGNTIDREGRLISCQHAARNVVRREADGKVTVLADKFEGKLLNSPNDVAVRNDGTLWFTDPDYGLGKRAKEQPGNFVYRLDPKTGALAIVQRDFHEPNGLCFAPDHNRLYVADSGKKQRIGAFPVQADHTLGAPTFWIEGGSDGMRCDRLGNLYTTHSTGVRIFSPEGKSLATIQLDQDPTNCAFGGTDGKTLFVTARTDLYRVPLLVAGASMPAVK